MPRHHHQLGRGRLHRRSESFHALRGRRSGSNNAEWTRRGLSPDGLAPVRVFEITIPVGQVVRIRDFTKVLEGNRGSSPREVADSGSIRSILRLPCYPGHAFTPLLPPILASSRLGSEGLPQSRGNSLSSHVRSRCLTPGLLLFVLWKTAISESRLALLGYSVDSSKSTGCGSGV
jgi:hypothetical protein